MTYFYHTNFNVRDLPRSLAFYREALGLVPVREIAPDHGKFKIVFLSDGITDYRLELTWLRDHPGPYDLGEGEFHLAMRTDEYDALHARHQAMGCICYENTDMGLYFIEDPDGYWIEIVPVRD